MTDSCRISPEMARMVVAQGNSPIGFGTIGRSAAVFLIKASLGTDRPIPSTDFEEAAAWKLATLVKTHHKSGTVLVLQEEILKDLPSGKSQRAGIRKGLGALTPLFEALPSPTEGELEGLSGRAAAILERVKFAGAPVAILSMVPISEHIPVKALRKLPPIYTFEMAPLPHHKKQLRLGEFGAVVVPILNGNNTALPARNLEARFNQRFKLLTE